MEVDRSVSSFTAMKIPFDELGIDLMLAGTQKALALPAGAAVFACSEKAFAKAATIKDRGYYFDFLEFKKNAENSMTPTTPSISHFYALQSKLEDIFAEGLDARYARHLENAKLARAGIRNCRQQSPSGPAILPVASANASSPRLVTFTR